MTSTAIVPAPRASGGLLRGPGLRRAALLVAVLAGAGIGILDAPPASLEAVSGAGDGLARLLRFMAVLKGTMVLAAVGAVLWRLGDPISPPRLIAYLAVAAAAAAGPGFVWNLSHLGLGAVLLHGGLLAILLLLWRDPAVPARLAAAVDRRRASLRAGAAAARSGQRRHRGAAAGKASTPAV